ncbi:MAG: hypothetical protein GX971_05370 [Firmicutes bacterium]|nr:hypothetical protein [Bacillota bacterium]
MSLLVYETAVDFESGDQFLGDIRQTVQQLKTSHPELKHYSLADLAVKKGKNAINVTLYFQPRN